MHYLLQVTQQITPFYGEFFESRWGRNIPGHNWHVSKDGAPTVTKHMEASINCSQSIALLTVLLEEL